MSERILFPAAAALLLACVACGGGGGGGGGGGPTGNTQFGTVSGSVTQVGGAGVAGATLELSRSGATTRTATSAQNGSFQFTSVDVGTWTLAVAPPSGFTVSGSATASVNVTANQTATVNFQLQEAVTQPPQSGTIEVTMVGSQFTPDSVAVTVGSTVLWRNNDSVEHNVTGSGLLSGTLAPGENWPRVMDQAGRYEYACTFHSGMNGVVTVH